MPHARPAHDLPFAHDRSPVASPVSLVHDDPRGRLIRAFDRACEDLICDLSEREELGARNGRDQCDELFDFARVLVRLAERAERLPTRTANFRDDLTQAVVDSLALPPLAEAVLEAAIALHGRGA